MAAWAAWGVVAFATAIVLAHGGLLPLGRWQGDEYIEAAFAHAQGVDYFVGRITGSSPRPVSEAVLCGYFWLVSSLQRPLIQAMLGVHWGVLAIACFATLRWRLEPLVWRLLAGMSLLCLYFLGHDVTELFFWPAGVAPYLETLAGVSVLLFLTFDGRLETGAGRLFGIACLSVAAAASEAGAMFAIPYAGLRVLSGLRRASAWGWAVPLAVGIAVLGVIATSARLTTGEPVTAGSLTMHRPIASLLAGLPQLGAELVSLEDGPLSLKGVAAGLVIKGLLFVALRWCWRLARPEAERPSGLAVFVVAVLVGSFGTIVAAEYQYGAACCARHASLRQCWFLLGIAALAALAAPVRVGARARGLTPALLALAIGLAFLPRLGGLISDAGLRSAAISARADTWASGLAPGMSMVMRMQPGGAVVRDSGLTPGHYRAADQPPLWWTTGIMLFFDKTTLDVEPARPAGQ